jgi:hypothetical protein
MRFVPGSGKYALDFENEVYFACFAGEEEKVGMAMNNGSVIERDPGGLGMEEEIISGITSNEDGRGKFRIKISKNKEYVFMAKEGTKTKKFLILGEKDFISNTDDKMGTILMSMSKKVLKWGEKFTVEVQKGKKVLTNDFKIVIVDKTNLVYETSFKMESGKINKEVDLKNVTLQNGGVLTVQLYKAGQTKEAIQESLIYVEPKQKLEIGLRFNKKRYAPRDQVELDVQIQGEKEGIVGVVVSDETPYLEIEKRNYPVSLCSKVFLEKELNFKSGEWVNSVKYIDQFFENNQDQEENKNALNDLECLLGIQDWRLFFLTETKVREFAKSPKKDLEDSLRYLLALSPEKIKEIYEPPRPEPRFMAFNAIARAAPMRMDNFRMMGKKSFYNF